MFHKHLSRILGILLLIVTTGIVLAGVSAQQAATQGEQNELHDPQDLSRFYAHLLPSASSPVAAADDPQDLSRFYAHLLPSTASEVVTGDDPQDLRRFYAHLLPSSTGEGSNQPVIIQLESVSDAQ